MAWRKCEGCGVSMPFGKRRTKHPETGALVCDGCYPGKPGAPGRPVGHHGAKEAAMRCEACGGEMGADGLVRTGGILRHANGCPKTAAEQYVVRTAPHDPDADPAEAGSYDDLTQAIRAAQDLATSVDPQEADVVIDQGSRRVWTNGWAGTTFTGSRQVVAHDLGDGETVAHCPFCGSGQVTARSDGTAQCGFCRHAFTVQVQPEFPDMPQTVDGVPVNDPSMPDHADQTPGQALDGGFAPAGSAAPAEGEFAPAGTAAPSADGFAPAGTAPRVATLRTASGDEVSFDSYLRYLAIQEADDRAAVLASMRQGA